VSTIERSAAVQAGKPAPPECWFLENIVNDRKASMTEEAIRARSARAAELVPIGREGTYDEIARSILFLASDESTYTTGASLLIDGGWLA
jgi:NAD(P)-dependent dehydrogenase (short-subunit alcohol dehydrogenase family)